MTPNEVNQLLTDDFIFYSKHAPMMVKPKVGKLVPLVLNNAQNVIHQKLEQQRKETGMERAVILKSRQVGASTLIGAKYYHRTSRQHSNNTFIITHKADATQNLFDMTLRYHNNVDPRLRTTTLSETNKSLVFKGLDSNYRVATAGSGETGRSYTITNFHGSEYAFWPNPEKIAAGALQAVPDMAGTSIIFESTANGVNNDFYHICMEAMQKKSEFQLIFIPWYIQEEYRHPVPVGFELTHEEIELKKQYNLLDEQLVWRRRKIDGHFRGKALKFMQEYPSNPMEAFQSTENSLIDIQAVQKARTNTVYDFNQPVVIGVDPARKKDRAVIAVRQGKNFKNAIVFNCDDEPMDPMELVDEIILAIGEHNPERVFIDSGEVGSGIVSILKNMGYSQLVVGVDFGQQAREKNRFENKRAEMWVNMAEFIEEGDCRIPDNDEVMADLLAMPDYYLNNKQRIQLMPKQKIRDDFKMSTDIGDAFALTFAFPVNSLNTRTVSRRGQFEQKKENRIKSVKRKTQL